MRAIGTFNVVNAGVCSRFEMARLIATHYGVEARAVELEEFGLTARRPISQVVKPVKLRNLGLTPDIQSWQAALKAYLTEWDTRDDG
jgi:dTDP-4-dehydrorhamnose reductase